MSMKKVIFILIINIFLFTSCLKSLSATQMLILDDDNYDEKYIDIYTNRERYNNMKISLCGKYEIFDNGENTYYYVTRYGIGVCALHEYEYMGFELQIKNPPDIEEQSWVRVEGYIECYLENGVEFLRIADAQISIEDSPEIVYVH